MEHRNANLKDTLSRWMEDNEIDDWIVGAYIVNPNTNDRAIESTGEITLLT